MIEFDILKRRAGQRRETMNLEANIETKNHRSVFTLCLSEHHRSDVYVTSDD